jgi:hypothetical protein
MSVNIGTPAVQAIKELQGNRHAEDMIAALGVFAQTAMLSALRSPPDQRVDQTSYARGMYDLWTAMHAAYCNLNPGRVEPPPLVSGLGKPREKVNA